MESIIQNLKEKISQNTCLSNSLIKKINDINSSSQDIIYLYYPLLFNSYM